MKESDKQKNIFNSYVEDNVKDQMKKSPEQIIRDFLQKKKLKLTLQTFNKEYDQYEKYEIENDYLQKLNKSFESGNRIEFFSLFEKLLEECKKKKENIPKLLMFLNLYFLIYPLHPEFGNEQNLNKSNVVFFKNFLEQHGNELSMYPELIPYFAIPYFKDLKNHPSFSNLFKKQFYLDLKNQMNQFTEKLLQKKQNNTELELILNSLLKKSKSSQKKLTQSKKKQNALKQQIAELKSNLERQKFSIIQKEKQSKETMKLIHQKWANFVNEVIDLSKELHTITQNYDLLEKDKISVQQASNQIEEYQKFLHQNIEELFYENDSSKCISNNLSKIKSQIQMLDFTMIKNILVKSSNISYVCAILEALRWKISKAKNSILRREIVIQYTSYEVISYKIFKALIEKKSKSINEYLIALLNTLASEYLGRTYLLENVQLIKHLIYILKSETKETFIRKNCLGILQKLSLRKKPQELLIQNDIIKWAVNIIQKEKNNLSDYSLEYLAAMLLNLSLRTIGKNKFDEIKYTALNLLLEFIDNKNQDLRTYVNGTLYSLFTKPSIQKLAKEMKFSDRLEKLIEDSDETNSKRYQFVLDQLLNENFENNQSEINEDENDVDIIDEDEVWGEEENEIPPPNNHYIKGEDLLKDFSLQGDEADKQFQMISAIMEETLNQSKFYINKDKNQKDDFFLRPSTPFKLPTLYVFQQDRQKIK